MKQPTEGRSSGSSFVPSTMLSRSFSPVFRPNLPKKFFENDSFHRCDRFRQIFVQIGAILAIFRPFEVFGRSSYSSFVMVRRSSFSIFAAAAAGRPGRGPGGIGVGAPGPAGRRRRPQKLKKKGRVEPEQAWTENRRGRRTSVVF